MSQLHFFLLSTNLRVVFLQMWMKGYYSTLTTSLPSSSRMLTVFPVHDCQPFQFATVLPMHPSLLAKQPPSLATILVIYYSLRTCDPLKSTWSSSALTVATCLQCVSFALSSCTQSSLMAVRSASRARCNEICLVMGPE